MTTMMLRQVRDGQSEVTNALERDNNIKNACMRMELEFCLGGEFCFPQEFCVGPKWWKMKTKRQNDSSSEQIRTNIAHGTHRSLRALRVDPAQKNNFQMKKSSGCVAAKTPKKETFRCCFIVDIHESLSPTKLPLKRDVVVDL